MRNPLLKKSNDQLDKHHMLREIRKNLPPGSRVFSSTRSDHGYSAFGVVEDFRVEEVRPGTKAIWVKVKWDDGSISATRPIALELVKRQRALFGDSKIARVDGGWVTTDGRVITFERRGQEYGHNEIAIEQGLGTDKFDAIERGNIRWVIDAPSGMFGFQAAKDTPEVRSRMLKALPQIPPQTKIIFVEFDGGESHSFLTAEDARQWMSGKTAAAGFNPKDIWRYGGWLLPNTNVVPSVKDDKVAFESGAIKFDPDMSGAMAIERKSGDRHVEARMMDFMKKFPPPETLSLKFKSYGEAEETAKLLSGLGIKGSLRKRLSASYENGYAPHAAAYLREHGNTFRHIESSAKQAGLDPSLLKEAVRTLARYAKLKKADILADKPRFKVQEPVSKNYEGQVPDKSLVMYLDGREIGAIGYLILQAAPKKTFQIVDAYVFPEHRGRGYGKRMYLALFTHAKKSGAKYVLSDEALSPDAERIWESLKRNGLAQIDVEDDQYYAKVARALQHKEAMEYTDDEWREILEANGWYPTGTTEERWTKRGFDFYVVIDHAPEGEPFYLIVKNTGEVMERGDDTWTLEMYTSDKVVQQEELQPIVHEQGLSEADIDLLKQMKIKASREQHGFIVPLTSAAQVAHELVKAGLDFAADTETFPERAEFMFDNDAELEVAYEIVRQAFKKQIESGKDLWANWKQFESMESMMGAPKQKPLVSAASEPWVPGTVDENFKPSVSVSGVGRVGQPSRLRSRPRRHWVVNYYDGTRSQTGYEQKVAEELGTFKTGYEAAIAASTFAKEKGWTLSNYALSMLRGRTAGPISRALLPAALLGLSAVPTTDPAVLPRQPAPVVQQKEINIDDLVRAIARTEGASPDLHNPGNLVGFHSGEIMQFKNDAQGVHALKNALNRIAEGKNSNFKPSMTLEEAGLVYSNGDPNWAKNVSRILGVDLKTPFAQLIKGKAKVAADATERIFETMAACDYCKNCLRHASLFRLVEHLKADHKLADAAHDIATEAFRRISKGRQQRQIVTAEMEKTAYGRHPEDFEGDTIREKVADLMEQRCFSEEESSSDWVIYARNTEYPGDGTWLKVFFKDDAVDKVDLFDQVPEKVIKTYEGFEGLFTIAQTFGD